MIITSAGRRVDAVGAKEERFPLSNADRVAEEVKSRLESLGAGVLVCSAACGADLIALNEAGKLGLRARIVLPFAPAHFRRTSVVDRPGNSTWDWGDLFDEFVKRASDNDDLVVLSPGAGGTDDDTAAYVETNRRLIAEALNLSRIINAPGRGGADAKHLRALIMWEGGSRGEDDVTADFADRARRALIPLEEISTV